MIRGSVGARSWGAGFSEQHGGRRSVRQSGGLSARRIRVAARPIAWRTSRASGPRWLPESQVASLVAMSERGGQSHRFFAGYFNQDWAISGAATWSDVMDEYLAQNRRDDAVRTRDDLRSWLAEAGHDQQLPVSFGRDDDSSPDGMDQHTWVAALADYIERKVGD